MAFYYKKNWSENPLNFLLTSLPLNKPCLGEDYVLNNRSRDGEMTLFGDPGTEKVFLPQW